MAGHSKWANIRHRKGAQDAKRAKVFAKFSKEIMVAASRGGADLSTNASLRLAVGKARSQSMPKKNIESAIAKATGQGQKSDFKEITYGGNVGGVSFLIFCLVDNVNRISAKMQAYFNKANGSLESSSSVMYIFDRKGVLEIAKGALEEAKLMEIAIESGADDFETEGDSYFVYTSPAAFSKVKDVFEKRSIIDFRNAEVRYIANTEVALSVDKANRILDFIDRLEDDEDVQDVYHNLDAASLIEK